MYYLETETPWTLHFDLLWFLVMISVFSTQSLLDKGWELHFPMDRRARIYVAYSRAGAGRKGAWRLILTAGFLSKRIHCVLPQGQCCGVSVSWQK